MATDPSPEITTRPQVGIGVVVERDGKILLGQRKGSHGAGEWGLPGGKLDAGEAPFECAARELAEETGIEIGDLTALPYWSSDLFPSHDRHFITLYVHAHWKSGEAQLLEPDKCSAWSWANWDDLPEPLFCGVRSLAEMLPQLNSARFIPSINRSE